MSEFGIKNAAHLQKVLQEWRPDLQLLQQYGAASVTDLVRASGRQNTSSSGSQRSGNTPASSAGARVSSAVRLSLRKCW
ncbi:unnamed protein product [Gongylonema pulchrum]|uniref:HRDC domain-containing protein n=1 Tax=Gongylonema pulchrum TaxID=637853 RepID=A0A183DUX3_9BILA|nr:unnamed protein product [Gongylonema pulchrum]